jgi:hypothetical protein
MRLLLILLSLLHYQSLLGQNCSNDSLFNRFKYDLEIETLNRFDDISWHDETKESYYKLMIHCPIECLVKYTDDSIPAIRAIIFGGLVEKNVDDDILDEIMGRHKNDTAQFILSPTDVVMTLTVRDYMQSFLRMKANSKTFNTDHDFDSRLENLRSSLQETIRVYIPGEYHSLVTKDDLLLIDSLTGTLQGYRIVSFDLITDTKSFSSNNIFTQEIKEFIRTMKSGNWIYIADIRVEFPNNSIGEIAPKFLRIK